VHYVYKHTTIKAVLMTLCHKVTRVQGFFLTHSVYIVYIVRLYELHGWLLTTSQQLLKKIAPLLTGELNKAWIRVKTRSCHGKHYTELSSHII